jgi:hypothetical protein
VVPVLGLLAETVLGDRFTEDDMTPLRALHRFRAADRETLDWALSSGQDFLDEPAVPLSQEQRARLLSLLGSHGIKTAMDALDAGTAGASALLAVLRAHSGIDVLLGQLRRQFIDRADPLRARRAIQALDALTWLGVNPAETAALTKLREELDEVREHPRLRQFALMDSLTELNSGRWQAPDGAEAELAALATGIDLADQLGIDPAAAPTGIRELLVKRITAWHILENTSSRVTYRHARAVREYLESLFRTVPPE